MMTVTGAEQVAVCPVGLVAVPVKVVLPVMADVVVDPPLTGETAPIPSMLNVAAFVVVHVSDARAPDSTDAGCALSEQVGATGGGGTLQ